MSTSKDYNNCPLKRSIQKTLFPRKADIILGLSSPEIVPSYIEVLPKRKELYLVNYEPKDEAINASSLVGMFDVLTNNGIVPDFIDADFCDSIKGSGADLLYLYHKCQAFRKKIDIAFTFAVRGITLDATMKWLTYFNMIVMMQTPYEYKNLDHRQFAYQYGDFIHYRESGEQMITGVIHIDPHKK